ncbi:hypothetical protein TanjilG_02753 [Lupinus angustifolius]|uniref:Uncharacterized protein n=1 Tax=Lupinus angustifolius TaxID=3871 RepID=A0A394DDZ6_LUPAN|nr:hypothetical protein TanjilG_02753 [Lupinus angustifolius]
MTLSVINALNGIYTIRGCDQPLIVQFVDPKRPHQKDSRFLPNTSVPMGDRMPPPNAWCPMHPPNGFQDMVTQHCL